MNKQVVRLMDVKIIVATHKQTLMPSDSIYLPVHVGREGKTDLGYQGDNTGDNISSMNDRYCELTGLYWAWKNLDADYIGLAQYRRHFKGKYDNKDASIPGVLTGSEASALLSCNQLLLPKRRNYRIQTLAKHLECGSFAEPGDYESFRNSIKTISPEYLSAFDQVMQRTWGHMLNMFIMERSLLDEYCSWLFPILYNLDCSIAPNRSRVLGYFAEHMLDIWSCGNNYSYLEVDTLLLDNQNELRKKIGFLLRIVGMKKASDAIVGRKQRAV